MPVLVALALTALARQEKTADISYRPHFGVVRHMKLGLTSTFMQQGQPVNFSFAANVDYLIKSKESDQFVLQSTTSGLDLKFNDKPFRLPQDATTTTAKVYATGIPVLTQEDAKSNQTPPRGRMAEMFYRAQRPLKINEDFDFTIQGDPSVGTRNAQGRETVTGEETVGGELCWKVTYIYTETEGPDPASVVGTGWIAEDTGDTVQFIADYTAVPFSKMMAAASAHFELVSVP